MSEFGFSSISLGFGIFTLEKCCSGDLVRFSDNSSYHLPISKAFRLNNHSVLVHYNFGPWPFHPVIIRVPRAKCVRSMQIPVSTYICENKTTHQQNN